MLEDGTRGAPASDLTWSVLSLREIKRKLAAKGFRARKDAAAWMLREAGYSLQGMAKVKTCLCPAPTRR